MIRFGLIATSLAPPLLLAAGLLGGSTPVLAQAPCVQWDVSGVWAAMQRGQYYGGFDIQQSGSLLSGSASQGGGEGLPKPARGLDGHIQGAAVEFTVYWHHNSIGVYSGTIGPTGRIEGTTFDKLSPNNRASWFSSRQMNCLAREAAAPPPAAPPRAKALGKKKSNVLVPEPSTGPSPFGKAKSLDSIRETDRGILLDP